MSESPFAGLREREGPRRRHHSFSWMPPIPALLVLAVLAVVSVSLCLGKRQSAPWASSAGASGFQPPTLTTEQQAAWNKVRREYGGGHLLVSWMTGSSTWLMRSSRGMDIRLVHAFPRHEIAPDGFTVAISLPGTCQPDISGKVAQNIAEELGTEAVAVIDVSGATPRLISWHFDDGSGARRYQSAPTPALQSKLDACFYELMTRAGKL